jgi:predicted metal-dependent hydrolase
LYPKPYIEYLVHFHGDRDYFECHEVLEEYWKEDPPGQRKIHWVGLIQIAVGLYHHRRSNWKGAHRMISNALAILEEEKDALLSLVLNPEKTAELLRKRSKDIENKRPYESVNLPLEDSDLLTTCIEYCENHQLQWGHPSDLSNNFLIHKHSLRDRSDVIAERKNSLIRKQQKTDEA